MNDIYRSAVVVLCVLQWRNKTTTARLCIANINTYFCQAECYEPQEGAGPQLVEERLKTNQPPGAMH